MRPQRCTEGLGDGKNGTGRSPNKRGLLLSVQARVQFSVSGCFVLLEGQEDMDAVREGKQIVSLSSRDGGRQEGRRGKH